MEATNKPGIKRWRLLQGVSNAMVIVCGFPPMMDVIKIYTILSSSVGLQQAHSKAVSCQERHFKEVSDGVSQAVIPGCV